MVRDPGLNLRDGLVQVYGADANPKDIDSGGPSDPPWSDQLPLNGSRIHLSKGKSQQTAKSPSAANLGS